MSERPHSNLMMSWREADRLAALHSFHILDTETEAFFEDIAQTAARICHAPIGLIGFMDESRQWFKASYGIEIREAPRDQSLCTYTMCGTGLFVVPDLKKASPLKNTPLLGIEPHVSFYAGLPLTTKDGLPLGTLCVLDHEARQQSLTEQQSQALNSLAQAVMNQLQLRQSERLLADSEARFRTLVDVMPLSFLSPQAVWFSDKNGNFTYCNEYWYDYTGLERDKCRSQGWSSAAHPSRREQSLSLLNEAFSKDSSFEVEIPIRRALDDTYRWFIVRGQPLKDENGKVEQWFGTAMDIHERKQSEEAHRNSEERLQLALKAARMVAWEYNPRTKAVKRSESSLTSRRIATGRDIGPFERVHPADQAIVGHFLERIEIHGSGSVECRCVHPNGELRWLRARAEKAGQNRIVGVTFDITDQKEAEEEIWRAANHDPLTGLPNRSLFQRRLEAALTDARQNGTSVSLLMVDLDEFKDINDTLGHDAGDALLKETASRLSAMVRDCDTVARLGGDEFALLVVEPLKLENAARLGSLILETLRQPFVYQKRTLISRVSIGVAAFPDHDSDPSELMKDADIALYQAKSQGRHRILTYSPEMRRQTEERVTLGRTIREAVVNHEIVPFYQPKVSLDTGKIVGFEALARWQHPRQGTLTPATFGAAFEDHELASDIGKLLMSAVATDLRRWIDDDLPIGRVALNLSPAEFIQPGMVDNILRTLDWIKVPPTFLEVEVTETVLLGRKSDNVSKLLEQFRRHDIHIALDDFGTGYASLTHLKQFPVNHIKIDRSFVQNLEHDPDDEAIIAAVIGLGKSLKLQVTAEGVETVGQIQRLRNLGCDHVQGFFYAKPIPASDVPGLLARWDHTSIQHQPHNRLVQNVLKPAPPRTASLVR